MSFSSTSLGRPPLTSTSFTAESFASAFGCTLVTHRRTSRSGRLAGMEFLSQAVVNSNSLQASASRMGSASGAVRVSLVEDAERRVEPRKVASFALLRALQSTGSILYDAHYDWIREHFKRVSVQSVSGGTDIVGCFVLGNPLLSVYRGESQCVSLGLEVRVMTEAGLQHHGEGELLCVNPFPSRPIGVWRDEGGQRFHDIYFAQNPGMWTHGDVIRIDPRGSARILGRSDATFKIGGVRIGPAEIYSVVLRLPGVADAMAVEQTDPHEPGGARIVLLLVMSPGVVLGRAMTLKIKRELHDRRSPNHMPGLIVQVNGLPQTYNGKYSEKAARDVINGRQVSNLAAFRNSVILDEIRNQLCGA